MRPYCSSRHIDDTALTHEIPRYFDRVAKIQALGPVGAFESVEQDHRTVTGVGKAQSRAAADVPALQT